jgi:hypothetical protein
MIPKIYVVLLNETLTLSSLNPPFAHPLRLSTGGIVLSVISHIVNFYCPSFSGSFCEEEVGAEIKKLNSVLYLLFKKRRE